MCSHIRRQARPAVRSLGRHRVCRRGITSSDSGRSNLTLIGVHIRCRLPIFSALAAITFGIAVATAPTSVLAEAQIRGTVEAVSIEANNTSVKEILAALSNAFDVRYRSAADLEKPVNVTYTGPLLKVLKRVLDGYSFFVKIGDGEIELTVLQSSNAAPTVAAPPSIRIAERPVDATPAEASSEIAVVTPPVPPTSQAVPSSRGLRGDHPLVDTAKGPRPSLTRRIKIATSGWRRRFSHARRTSLAYSSIFGVSRTSAFATNGVSVRYPWFPRRASRCAVRTPFYLRSLPVWRAAATKVGGRGPPDVAPFALEGQGWTVAAVRPVELLTQLSRPPSGSARNRICQ
jgi:hypothetical protein